MKIHLIYKKFSTVYKAVHIMTYRLATWFRMMVCLPCLTNIDCIVLNNIQDLCARRNMKLAPQYVVHASHTEFTLMKSITNFHDS